MKIRLLKYMICVLVLSGCVNKGENFSDIPEITSFSYRDNLDSTASLIVKFRDGDGDFGLGENDTFPPYDTSSLFYHNLFFDFYELRENVWVKKELTFPFYYRIEPVESGGENKSLDGEFIFTQSKQFIFGLDFDTVKWTAQIADRSLNLSNIAETDTLIRN